MIKLKNLVRKWMALAITVCLLGTIAPINAYAESLSDITGHWAMGTIEKWSDQGAVNGYEDGTFKPENNITRGEFISLVNGIFGYADNGYISGYPDGTMRLESLITREEAATVIMKISLIEANDAASAVFKDSTSLSWSKGAVGAVYAAGIMNGYPDGTFKGQSYIHRAEALVALDKAFLNKAGAIQEANTALNYVALGDSIAYGSKVAEGLGYVDLLTEKLMGDAGVEPLTALNLSKPGKNSSWLLTDLKTDEGTRTALKNADVVTISIGGNNLLKPVITEIETTFGLDSKSETFNSELTLVLANKVNRDKLKAILAGISPDLEVGVQKFKEDWPEIIKTVKALSPDAELYVMTIYNPMKEGDSYYSIVDNPIREINAIIAAHSDLYKVADVYVAFNHYTGSEALTNFNLLRGSFDVHPTAKGYETIYQCHIN